MSPWPNFGQITTRKRVVKPAEGFCRLLKGVLFVLIWFRFFSLGLLSLPKHTVPVLAVSTILSLLWITGKLCSNFSFVSGVMTLAVL